MPGPLATQRALPSLQELRRARCEPLGPQSRLQGEALALMLARLAGQGWTIEDDRLCKRFVFPDFARTMAFVQAVATLASTQDHHPQMLVEYGSCALRWDTHSAGGLTLNDFVCAAQVDALPQ